MDYENIIKEMAEEISNLRYYYDDETGDFSPNENYYKKECIIEEYKKCYGGK